MLGGASFGLREVVPFDDSSVLLIESSSTSMAFGQLGKDGLVVRETPGWVPLGAWTQNGRVYFITAEGLKTWSSEDGFADVAPLPNVVPPPSVGEKPRWTVKGGGGGPELFTSNARMGLHFVDGSFSPITDVTPAPGENWSGALWRGEGVGAVFRGPAFTFFDHGSITETGFVAGDTAMSMTELPGLGLVAGSRYGLLVARKNGDWVEIAHAYGDTQVRFVLPVGDGALFGGEFGQVDSFHPWSECPAMILGNQDKLSFGAKIGQDYILGGDEGVLFYLTSLNPRPACLEPLELEPVE